MHLFQHAVHHLKTLFHARHEGSPAGRLQHRLQVQLDDGQGLADFVVEFAGDVPAFGLLRLHQPAGKHLEFAAVFLELLLRPPAFRDVTDVALNHPVAVDLINVADKFHIDGPAVPGFQRNVVVTDVGFALQVSEFSLGRPGVLERDNVPEPVSQHLLPGIAQHVRQERVDIINLPGVRIENQDSVLRGFKQPAIAHFGNLQRVFRRTGFRSGLFQNQLWGFHGFSLGAEILSDDGTFIPFALT